MENKKVSKPEVYYLILYNGIDNDVDVIEYNVVKHYQNKIKTKHSETEQEFVFYTDEINRVDLDENDYYSILSEDINQGLKLIISYIDCNIKREAFKANFLKIYFMKYNLSKYIDWLIIRYRKENYVINVS